MSQPMASATSSGGMKRSVAGAGVSSAGCAGIEVEVEVEPQAEPSKAEGRPLNGDAGEWDMTRPEYYDLTLADFYGYSEDGEEVQQWLTDMGLARHFAKLQAEGYDDLRIIRNVDEDEEAKLIRLCEMPEGHARQFRRGLARLRSAVGGGGIASLQAPPPPPPPAAAAPASDSAQQAALGAAPPLPLVPSAQAHTAVVSRAGRSPNAVAAAAATDTAGGGGSMCASAGSTAAPYCMHFGAPAGAAEVSVGGSPDLACRARGIAAATAAYSTIGRAAAEGGPMTTPRMLPRHRLAGSPVGSISPSPPECRGRLPTTTGAPPPPAGTPQARQQVQRPHSAIRWRTPIQGPHRVESVALLSPPSILGGAAGTAGNVGSPDGGCSPPRPPPPANTTSSRCLFSAAVPAGTLRARSPVTPRTLHMRAAAAAAAGAASPAAVRSHMVKRQVLVRSPSPSGITTASVASSPPQRGVAPIVATATGRVHWHGGVSGAGTPLAPPAWTSGAASRSVSVSSTCLRPTSPGNATPLAPPQWGSIAGSAVTSLSWGWTAPPAAAMPTRSSTPRQEEGRHHWEPMAQAAHAAEASRAAMAAVHACSP